MFLNQYVEESTRGENTLLFFFSNEEIIENLRVGDNSGLSDHQVIRLDLKLGSKAHIKMLWFQISGKKIGRDL